MADPVIQTFCCIANNRTRLGLDSLLHYRYESYNAICMVSSVFGILGACYQILPREYEGRSNVMASFVRGRQIIVWLATADLLACLAVFIRASSWLLAQYFETNQTYYVGSMFCAISSGWIQYFYGVTYIWTLIYAIDVLRVIAGIPSNPVAYHLTVWSIPLFCTFTGLMILYYPDLNCHAMESNVFRRILPNYLLTYLPILIVMIINPLLYLRASSRAEKLISASGRFTSTERKQLRILRWKFLAINLAFLMCWIPNILNAVAIWTLWFRIPREPILVSAYFMAILNPLQALFNAFVYRKWGDSPSAVKIRFPWKKQPDRRNSEDDHLLGEGEPEDLSSLSTGDDGSRPKSANMSINGYGSL